VTKRTIEIEDVLPECVESAIEDVEALLREYVSRVPYRTSVPDLGNDLDCHGRVHEIVDGAVPIYTRDIEAAWFLHGRELEQAYENAGVGSNPRENDGMAAIYYYISEAVAAWYSRNAEKITKETKK
jgi:hypothetical protein